MADIFGIDIDKLISKKDKAIVRSENDLLSDFDNIEQKVFDAVKKKINQMNIEGGKILFDDTNTAIVNEIDATIKNALQGSNYPSQVKDFLRSFETIREFNFDVQKNVNDLSEKELSDLINPIQQANVQQTLDGLTGSGVSTNFIQPVREGIYKNIVAGTTISDMEIYLTNYILSNPERMSGLKRYVTQVSRDSLNQFDGQVNSHIAETFGLDAFRYVGSLIDDSRPQCIRWVGKNVLLLDELQSELNWAYNNGSGMIPGTTPNNFAVFRGGYNCRHSAIPFKLTKSQRAELAKQDFQEATPEQPKQIEWSPSMNLKDANVLIENSVFKQDFYHVTKTTNLESLMKNGFDLNNKSGFGRVWGDGVYLSDNQKTVDWYGNENETSKVKIKINVNKPLVVEVGRDAKKIDEQLKPYGKNAIEIFNQKRVELEKEWSRLFDNAPKDKNERIKYFNEIELPSPFGQALAFTAKKLNFDSMVVIEKNEFFEQMGPSKNVGGNQTIVFDPKNVIIIK